VAWVETARVDTADEGGNSNTKGAASIAVVGMRPRYLTQQE